ncbi:MAG: phosphoglycerate kinase [Acidilobaceae archaeon]
MLSFRGLKIATLDNVEVRKRRVLLRVDFNSPIDPNTGEILDYTRIKAHKETIEELLEKEAALVIVSHQGRPFDKDFTSLRQHSRALSKVLNREVLFVEDICFESAIKAIESLRPGEVLVLENVRLLAEEIIEEAPEHHARSYFVSKLSRYFSLFVNDAFSACHRSQASLVGFPIALPSVAGRLMEKELKALSKAIEAENRPRVFVLGGSKVDDALKAIDKMLSRGIADIVLTTGVTALVLLASANLIPPSIAPKQARDEGLVSLSRQILQKHADRIFTPTDFMVASRDSAEVETLEKLSGPPKDIGPETIQRYSAFLDRAGLIVMKGPAGVIEDPRFRRGTEELVMRALRSRAYTIFGGGHLISVVESMPETLRERAGHLSTAGGALLYAFSGEKLPCLEALSRSASIFNIT